MQLKILRNFDVVHIPRLVFSTDVAIDRPSPHGTTRIGLTEIHQISRRMVRAEGGKSGRHALFRSTRVALILKQFLIERAAEAGGVGVRVSQQYGP